MITSYLYGWDGSQTLTCNDFATGDEVVISIPFGQTPALYSQQLYKKAKKLKKSIGIVEALLNKTQNVMDYVEEIESSLTNIEHYQRYAKKNGLNCMQC